MKIIKEDDPRYKYLDQIFSSYSLEKINKYFDDKDGRYYYIPPELVLIEYEGCTLGIYKDPWISDDSRDNWVGYSSLSRILNRCCKLTQQEFFDIIELHINDTDDRPKCPYCGNYITYSGEMWRGYSRHPWIEYNPKHLFCCVSHRQKYIYDHPEEYPHLVTKVEKWMKKIPLNPIKQAKSAYYNIRSKLNLKDKDPLDFYVAYGNLGFKFGISINGEGRLWKSVKGAITSRSFTNYSYRIRLLEYVIKIDLYNKGLNSEYISDDKIKLFKESFKKYYYKIIDMDTIRFHEIDECIYMNTFTLDMI